MEQHPQAKINTLIRSIHQRYQAVLHAKDGHTGHEFGILIIDPFRIFATISLLLDKPSSGFLRKSRNKILFQDI